MPNEPVAPGAPTIPPPYALAQYFNKVFVDRSQLNGKMKVDAACGLMLYYLASEVARLADLLGGTVEIPVQDEAPPVPGASPEEGDPTRTVGPVDADAQRQDEGSD
jgi:hypothetical protein